MKNFEELKVTDFDFNPFDLKNQWILVTAADSNGKINTMTASWGGLGVMWNKNVAFIVVRPQRYTYDFIEDSNYFSLTFFDSKYKSDLGYLGRVSGRDEDKITKVGFHIMKDDNGIPYFNESKSALFVKKLFKQPLESASFLDEEIIPTWYPKKDFHILYIGEIFKFLKAVD